MDITTVLNDVFWVSCYSGAFAYAYRNFTHYRRMDAHQKQSIISLYAACVLAPLGVWETFFSSSENVRRQIHLFYIAYCLADIYHGRLYYPQYFTLLSGWLHHGMTGGYVVYCLLHHRLRNCCLAMIVEVPSIILFSSRVFRGHWLVVRCKKQLFCPLFILCRIILCGWNVMRVYRPGDTLLITFFSIFTILNTYWILTFMTQTRKK